MKRCIDVRATEVMAGCGDVILKSDAYQSCVVIAAHDPIRKIGALAHAFFSSNGTHHTHTAPALREAACAIDEMVSEMTSLGSQPRDIEVCLVGGENAPYAADDPGYVRAINSTLELLRQKEIRLKDGAVSDVGIAHAALDVSSGAVSRLEQRHAVAHVIKK